MTITEVAGFAGAGRAGAAYVPQIAHLVRARCSAGISRLAFAAWLLASVLTTARAVAIGAAVFIVLGGIQIVATTLIMLCAARYKDTPSPGHLLGQTMANAARGAGTWGNEPGSWRLADRPVAASAHTRQARWCAARVCPGPAPHSHPVIECQATHLKETA
jgi:hypothetical protein